ncbi:MAG TPA: alpha-L-fucosidase [Phycisphaerae bacterium]|nr:alpha-L-fucosidase [Phycisphaerae bacterium]
MGIYSRINDLFSTIGVLAAILNGGHDLFADSITSTNSPQSAATYPPDAAANLPKPTPRQAAWQDAELGMFFHFDIEVFDKYYQYDHPKNKPTTTTQAAGGGSTTKPASEGPELGSLSPAIFNPVKLNTDQWMQVAQSMGARYTVFTAKHSSGFLMWQSNLYPFGVRYTRWENGQGDVVQDFLTSCKKYGIKPGIYCSANGNSWWQVHVSDVEYEHGVFTGDPAAKQKFIDMDVQMYTQLFQHTGPLFEIWFDSGLGFMGDRMDSVLRQYEPDALYFNGPATGFTGNLLRWSGNETGYVVYPNWYTVAETSTIKNRSGDPNGQYYVPIECNVPLRYHVWMWQADDQNKILSLSSLMTMYLASVGRGCNLIVNANIDPDGLVPEADAQRLAEFGAEIKKWFGTSLAETTGRGNEVELQLDHPEQINFVTIMEDITQGQRIRAYAVDGLVDGQWKQLCTGESVGHKRIQQFDPVTVLAVRLRVTQAVAEPLIRKLAVYNIQTLPPDPNDPVTNLKNRVFMREEKATAH